FERSEIIILDRSNTPHVVLSSPPEKPYIFSLAWTPDGKRLRFATLDRSGTKLSSVSLHGEVRPLYRFPEIRLLNDIAPDGTMVFSIPGWVRRLAVMHPGQASQRELGLMDSAGIVDLSRDGRTLLFFDGEVFGYETTAVLGATDGQSPKVLGPGVPLALPPDGRTVAMTSGDQRRLFLVPAAAGTTEEVPLSSLVVGIGQWSRDGRRLWISARQSDHAGFQLIPVDVATRKLLDPIAGSDIIQTAIAISPDDHWIAATGADRVLTVYPVNKGEPIRMSSLEAALSPTLAGWTKTGELWVLLQDATPPRLVRVELPSGKITRSIDLDLRQVGGGAINVSDVRITPDESLLVVEYHLRRGRLELVRGIPADR